MVLPAPVYAIKAQGWLQGFIFAFKGQVGCMLGLLMSLVERVATLTFNAYNMQGQ